MKEIPEGIQDWDFSYAATLARETGVSKMRWRLGDDEWMCDEIVGACDMDSIKSKGHITVRGILDIVNEYSSNRGRVCDVAYLWPDPNAETEEKGELSGNLLPNTHWRLCANLQGGENDKWRLRDERTNKDDVPFIMHVRGYKGRAELNWYEGGPHVFHDGEVIIDEDNIAHLL